jgi:hypothetical protein
MGIRNRIKFSLAIFAVVAMLPNSDFEATAQEKKDPDIPETQVPVEKRDTGESLGETLGALPGRIVALPFRLVLTGISELAGVVDYNTVVLRVTDWLTNEDGTRKVRPIFMPISGGGLILIQDNFIKPGMRFRGVGSLGIQTRRYFYGGLQDLQLFSKNVGLKVEGFHQRLPDEKFFGIGNDSDKGGQSSYLAQENRVRLELLSHASGKAVFGVGFQFSDVKIEDGRSSNVRTIYDPQLGYTAENLPGLSGSTLGTLQIRVYHDSRNRPGNPTKGGEEFFSFEHTREIAGDQFGYNRFAVDLRRYLHLFYGRVLVLRTRTEITRTLDNREIPFFLLSGLGGVEVFRGARRTRFREHDLMLFGAEYRIPIHSLADWFFFGEEARVFPDMLDEFTFKDFKYAFGAGLRLRGRGGGLVASLELAKSKEDTRFYFELNKDLRRF